MMRESRAQTKSVERWRFDLNRKSSSSVAPEPSEFGEPECLAFAKPSIPAGASLRVVGDVHGDVRGFTAATATDRFIVQLGDLTDYGEDGVATLRAMLALLGAGKGLFLLGNHDRKLGRALLGRNVRRDAALAATISVIDPTLATQAIAAIGNAPAWLRGGDHFFVHAAFHTAMLACEPPAAPLATRVSPLLSRALYGETTGGMQSDGYPERRIDWVKWIPRGLTVFCGHDCRSLDGRPYIKTNEAGGRAVFLDTGAGKGGHLAWVDV